MAKFQKGQVANPNGRPKGSRNKVSVVIEKLTEEAIKGGIMPLDFFLSNLRNETMPLGFRYENAKAAAPYLHRKMPIAIENADAPFKVLDMSTLKGLSEAELMQLETLMAKAAAIAASEKDKPLDPRVTQRPAQPAPAPARKPAPVSKRPKPKGK